MKKLIVSIVSVALVGFGSIGTATAKKKNACTIQGAAIVGPVLEAAKIGKFRKGKKLDIWIEYLDTFGHTSVDAAGIHWNFANGKTIHGKMKYPPQYWNDDYPMYLIGKTMHVKVHVKNKHWRAQRRLRVVAIHEYLNIFGGNGQNLPGSSTKAWFLKKLKKNQTAVLDFVYYIPKGTMPGLDQTHVVITRCRNWKKKCCTKQRLLVNDPQAGLFCPPD